MGTRRNRHRHFEFEVVEQLIPVTETAGLSMTHLAKAFAIAHPGVTSTIIGPRTRTARRPPTGADVPLDDDVLNRINEIAPPGTDPVPYDLAYTPSALSAVSLRRRPVAERSAT
ncbi:hypothetical protein ACIQJT_38180 [Streptomyces sp. NPDC091972]|uniref:hypothetical protein n=1 Tax=Streptomyces sp. NPDC091972 TaxID=3366007 RepID=UPI00380EF9FB